MERETILRVWLTNGEHVLASLTLCCMAAAPPPASPSMRVAVVGAGAAGSAAARRLAMLGAHVTLFDQAEGGPGGRASARPIGRATLAALADHGAQFLRDDGACPALTGLLASLAEAGHAAPWTAGRFGRVRVGAGGDGGGFSPGGSRPASSSSFFGLTTAGAGGGAPPSTLWVGTPHADGLAKGLAAHERVTPAWGARVAGLEARADGRWGLRLASEGEGGAPAPSAAAAFDGVILADASMGRPAAPGRVTVSGAGPAADAAADLLSRVGRATARTPLFSVCALLPCPYPAAPFDAADVEGDSAVAFLVRDSAKPGRPTVLGGGETWVAISTPATAGRLLAAAPLSGGRPPAAALTAAAEELWAAAEEALVAAAGPGAPRPPPPLALRAQRWGAGLEGGAWTDEDSGGGGGASSLPRCAVDRRAPGLALCGDLFHGGEGASLAAAVRSGLAAAEAVGGGGAWGGEGA